MIRSFHPTLGSTKTVAASTTSANSNVIVGGASPGPVQIRVYNGATSVAFIRQGTDNSVTATAADLPVAPGSVEVLTFSITGTGLWLAAILASGTGNVYFTVGQGI